MAPLRTITKDPAAILDYGFDWRSWLAAGETITSFTVTVTNGITLNSSAHANGVIEAWLSGGAAGTTYTLNCQITTSASRVDERSIAIVVTER